MIPHRRPSVDARAVAKASSWHEGSRPSGKMGFSGEGRGAHSHTNERETGGGGGENDNPAQRAVHPRLKEELIRNQFGEGEEWRLKGRGWVNPASQPFAERILLNDEEEDGVHGGRMKPLTSFDLNRGMPPPQSRKLKIKSTSVEENPSHTMDDAAPKAIRMAQDKENGGLVPLCPGTTQIRGMKRKNVSPTAYWSDSDLKPQEGKRARPPNESPKTTDEPRKGPPREMEGDGSQGMDMLLMALAADPNQRLISPFQPMSRPTVVRARTGDKAVKHARPTLSARTAVAPVCQPQVQSKVFRESQTAPREELKAPRNKNHATMEYPQVQIKETVDIRKDDDENLSRSDDEYDLTPEEFERRYGPTMKPHRYRGAPCQTAPLQDALVDIKGSVDLRKDDDEDFSSSDDEYDLTPEEFDRRLGPTKKPHRYRRAPCQTVPLKDALGKIEGIVDVIKEDDEDFSSSNDVSDLPREDADRKYVPYMRPHRYRPASLKETLVSKNDKTKDREESICRGEDLDSTEDSLEKNVTSGQSYCMTSQEASDNLEENLEASKEGEGKSANPLERRRENKGEKSSCDANIIQTVITPHLSNVHPSQARVLWSQEKHINQRVLKENTITGLNCSTSVESHQLQHKVSEREPTRHDSSYVTSLREDFENSTVVENSHNINQEGDHRFLRPSTWGKHPGASQQLTRKELSGATRTTYDPQLWKKRKVTGRNSAFCIIPKQVKLATASCLIDNGESAHPSVGSVVVECLPPSTEQKQDNRAPFSEFQNKDAAAWSSYNSLQSATDVGIWDTDKENISWVPDTASDRPSSNGVKVPCTQKFEVITKAQDNTSSLHLSGLSSVARVSGSRALLDTSTGNSLHALQNSRTRVDRVDSETFYSSGSQYGSRVKQLQQQQQEQRSRSSPGAESGTCTSNEDNEALHEIGAISMQRRSWEALKSAEAEYFAKRRFDPNTEALYDNNYVPFIPSRFQNAEYPVQRVSNVKPKPDFETHLRHGATLSRSIGVTTHQGIAERRVTFRRGPKQGKQERLSTRVLNRNLEQLVQLNDASCHRGNSFSMLNQAQNGAHFPVDISQLQLPLALPRSYSGLPKLPSGKIRQRRGPKKIDKGRLKTTNTKTNSSSCIFKSLSEPSGLLGSLNPGIIGRMRNSKQIHAILGALIGVASSNEGREATPSASLPRVSQDSACVLVKSEAKGELKEKPVEVQETFLKKECVPHLENGEVQHSTMGKSTDNEQLEERDSRQEILDRGQPLLSNAEQCPSLELTSETHEILPECAIGLASLKAEAVNVDHLHEHSEPLTQMLSSVSGNPEYVDDDSDQELQPMSVMDSSSSAAGLAARWLELLSLDAKGRLSALKLSRRRVQSTLLSGPLNPDVMAVNPPSTRSATDMDVFSSQQSVCSDATTIQTMQDESSQQVDRWRALFTNMDVVLGNEATKLESWLWQINQMQAFCPSSTQQPFSGPEKSHAAFCQGQGTSNPEIGRQASKRWPLTIDAIEKELGFAASAASITSTANFVAKVQNFR